VVKQRSNVSQSQGRGNQSGRASSLPAFGSSDPLEMPGAKRPTIKIMFGLDRAGPTPAGFTAIPQQTESGMM